jgi:hypothetical protein
MKPFQVHGNPYEKFSVRSLSIQHVQGFNGQSCWIIPSDSEDISAACFVPLQKSLIEKHQALGPLVELEQTKFTLITSVGLVHILVLLMIPRAVRKSTDTSVGMEYSRSIPVQFLRCYVPALEETKHVIHHVCVMSPGAIFVMDDKQAAMRNVPCFRRGKYLILI